MEHSVKTSKDEEHFIGTNHPPPFPKRELEPILPILFEIYPAQEYVGSGLLQCMLCALFYRFRLWTVFYFLIAVPIYQQCLLCFNAMRYALCAMLL